MNLFAIIALIGIVALALIWPRKSALKGRAARTWPPGRGKSGLKPKLAPRL